MRMTAKTGCPTNITAAFASPYMVRHRDFFVTSTIGIAVFPDHGSFADELLRTAGLALHEAKTSGGNKGAIYSEHMRARSVLRLELETELRRALDSNELFLVYQPQIEVETGRIASVEALVRWRHPTRGIVPPDEFIPIAEESGLIVPLSDLVMRQALRQISEWWQAGCRDLRVAVNVSGAQFEAPGFPDWVFAHLDEAGLPGACLELEITESLLMVDEAAAALAVRAVRELGVHVAIDDFGTGYSSLAYLKHFPIEALKIDRSFVADLGRDSNDAAICAAIIAMGRQLGLKIVAEGVETRGAARVPRDARLHARAGLLHRQAGRGEGNGQTTAPRHQRDSDDAGRHTGEEVRHRRAAGGLRSRDAAEGGEELVARRRGRRAATEPAAWRRSARAGNRRTDSSSRA